MPLFNGLIKVNTQCDGQIGPEDPDASATIVATNTGTGQQYSAQGTGNYSMSVPAGSYKLSVTWDNKQHVLTTPFKTNEMGVVNPATASLFSPLPGTSMEGLSGVSNVIFLGKNATVQVNAGFFELPEMEIPLPPIEENGDVESNMVETVPVDFVVYVGSLNSDTLIDATDKPAFFVSYAGSDNVTIDQDGIGQFVMMDAFDNLNAVTGFNPERDRLNFKGVFFSGQVPYDGDTPIEDGVMILDVYPGVGTMVNVQFNIPGAVKTQQIFLNGVTDLTDGNIICR